MSPYDYRAHKLKSTCTSCGNSGHWRCEHVSNGRIKPILPSFLQILITVVVLTIITIRLTKIITKIIATRVIIVELDHSWLQYPLAHLSRIYPFQMVHWLMTIHLTVQSGWRNYVLRLFKLSDASSSIKMDPTLISPNVYTWWQFALVLTLVSDKKFSVLFNQLVNLTIIVRFTSHLNSWIKTVSTNYW